MRKILAIIGGMMYCIASYAQTDNAVAIARYTLKHVMDTTQPNRPVVTDFALHLGNTLSRYFVDLSRIAPTMSGMTIVGGALPAVGIGPGSSPTSEELREWRLSGSYMKQPAENKLVYYTLAGAKLFAVEEPLRTIEWQIANETKNIKGFDCQKATARFKGRDYEAWFSASIPYQDGPWKLAGLPGLILEAADTKKEVVFEFHSFEPLKDTIIEIKMARLAAKTTPKEYEQFRKALDQNARAGAGAGGGGGMVVAGTITAARTEGPAPSPIKMNNPIEKEN